MSDGEDFLAGGMDLLLRNDDSLKAWYIRAPKPASNSGLLRGEAGEGWRWDEHARWATLLELMRALGPQEVDVEWLYVTGFSMGAVAVRHLGMFYGRFLAAIGPISGRSQWSGETWPRHAKLPRN